MKKLVILLALVTSFLWIGSAAAITVDGYFSTDWGFDSYQGFNPGESAGDEVTGQSGNIYWWEEDSTSSYLGPGWGGEIMDVEGLYASIADGYFNFLIISGIRGSINQNLPDRYYEPGDILITLSNGKQYAIETTGYHFTLDSSGYVESIETSGLAGDVYDVSAGAASMQNGLASWAGKDDNQDPTQIHTIIRDPLVNLESDFIFLQPDNDLHSYIEGRIALSLLDLSGAEWINLHFADSCGNDGGTTPNAPVPEPATMLLFGIGLCGLAVVGRKRLVKSER